MHDATIGNLFVYGTLMTTAGAAQIGGQERARLHAAAVSLGPATVPGRMYDLGRYPALVEAGALNQRVHGEVLRLDDAPMIFTWLDSYESIDPDRPEASDYQRVVRQVRLVDGDLLAAWVYIFRRGLGTAPMIASGRWHPA